MILEARHKFWGEINFTLNKHEIRQKLLELILKINFFRSYTRILKLFCFLGGYMKRLF